MREISNNLFHNKDNSKFKSSQNSIKYQNSLIIDYIFIPNWASTNSCFMMTNIIKWLYHFIIMLDIYLKIKTNK